MDEVHALTTKGRVTESILFGPQQQLTYSLSRSDVPEMKAKLSEYHIEFTLPDALVREWAESERISLTHVQRVAEDTDLYLVVEKDLHSLFPRKGIGKDASAKKTD